MNCSYEVAIDLHDIPYHGQPALDPDEIRHGPAKSGTTHCHSYATLAIVHHAQRNTVALTFVLADESMAQVVERVLRREHKEAPQPINDGGDRRQQFNPKKLNGSRSQLGA